MDFVKLMKLIQGKVYKCSKWSEDEIPIVLRKCINLCELHELLRFCKYKEFNLDKKGDIN